MTMRVKRDTRVREGELVRNRVRAAPALAKSLFVLRFGLWNGARLTWRSLQIGVALAPQTASQALDLSLLRKRLIQ